MSRKLTKEEFIQKAIARHGDKYDYSKVDYVNNSTKVTIICPIHGEFEQIPSDHLRGKGCPRCGGGIKLTKEEFIQKAIARHGDKYDYSKVDYKGCRTKVTIICPIHGEFEQKPNNHLSGYGCPRCGGGIKLTKEEFIQKAIARHGDKYGYSKVDYINNSTKVTIICPIHGEFKQMPRDHLSGCGCPVCKSSKLEGRVRNSLSEYNIIFEEQKTWDWLVHKSTQWVDFFLPDFNLIIECQGEQHFKAVDFFGGEEVYKDIVERDKNKKSLCEAHNLKVVYVADLGKDYPYPYGVVTDVENFIKNLVKTDLTNQL